MTTALQSGLGRRALLRVASVGALGLAGAALLGCGGGGGEGGSGSVAADTRGNIQGGTSGFGLSQVAPVVAGKEKPGGTLTVAGGATTSVQFDAGTALGG